MLQKYFQPNKFLSLEPGMDRAKRQEYLKYAPLLKGNTIKFQQKY